MKKLAILMLVLALCLAPVCVLAEPTVADITYPSRGVEVPATLVLPDRAGEFSVVVLIHGHGGSRDEFLGFPAVAQALAERGIASLRMDFPGCGQSAESFQLNCLTNMKDDVVAAISYLNTNYDVEDIGLFGYSMGGRIALELLAEKRVDPEALVLLAPAADTADMKNLFGGEEAWATMRAEAEAHGFVKFTTIYGQEQELSQKWFDDLDVYADCAADAAKAWDEDALVICGADDEAVNPETVSKVVAKKLNAQVIDATGEGHGYGFYTEDDDTVRLKVANAAADFFAKHLDVEDDD